MALNRRQFMQRGGAAAVLGATTPLVAVDANPTSQEHGAHTVTAGQSAGTVASLVLLCKQVADVASKR